ncbi:hypothetical protein CRG98_043010 [Punica granatum]|uniref:Uncharacterized protein n=1 Tax=Punica granatum TaxID=22663 RepID=A0A2I0HYH4_PUNGR|nr:hypothetical protein CRG98_043010 [Punica granatum]
MVFFDQATYDKLLSEAPEDTLITPSILSDRLRDDRFRSGHATQNAGDKPAIDIRGPTGIQHGPVGVNGNRPCD